MLRRDYRVFTTKDLTEGIKAYGRIWAVDRIKAESEEMKNLSGEEL